MRTLLLAAVTATLLFTSGCALELRHSDDHWQHRNVRPQQPAGVVINECGCYKPRDATLEPPLAASIPAKEGR